VSQKQADITLTPSDTVMEKYVSDSHYVLCTSPKGVDMRWTHDSAVHITATKGRYVTSVAACPF
jgi:hypothetical protein